MRLTVIPNNITHVCRSFTLTEMSHDIQTTTMHQLMQLHLPIAKVANLGNGPLSNVLLQAPSDELPVDKPIKFLSIHQFLLLLLCRLWQDDNTATNQYLYVSELLWARRGTAS